MPPLKGRQLPIPHPLLLCRRQVECPFVGDRVCKGGSSPRQALCAPRTQVSSTWRQRKHGGCGRRCQQRCCTICPSACQRQGRGCSCLAAARSSLPQACWHQLWRWRSSRRSCQRAPMATACSLPASPSGLSQQRRRQRQQRRQPGSAPGESSDQGEVHAGRGVGPTRPFRVRTGGRAARRLWH